MTYHIEPDPGPDCPQIIRMVVEIPRGSSNKYEYDQELGVFKLSRALYSPMAYPGDYGFIPGTLGEDGDPYDILAMVTAPSYPGILYYVRPIGVLDMIDSGEPDHKILAVPQWDPRFANIHTVDDLAPHTKREIEHFFAIYKELEEKQTVMQGWRSREAAYEAIERSRVQFMGSLESPKSDAT